ncbi:MAG: PorT family protein [Bacteroidetes bacterium]|nr:MAG: PorT family protein [Bacteroidota bacterium]
MKTKLLLLIFFLCAQFLSAQKLSIGPEIGVISSFDSGYDLTDFEKRRSTYFMGVNVNYQISDHFSVASGLQYLRLGYQHETCYEFPEGVENLLVGKIDYLIMPLEIKYYLGKTNRLYTSLGLLIGYNIKAVQDIPERIGGCDFGYASDISGSVDDFGIGGNLGLGYTIFSNEMWDIVTEINANIISEITQLESFGSGLLWTIQMNYQL